MNYKYFLLALVLLSCRNLEQQTKISDNADPLNKELTSKLLAMRAIDQAAVYPPSEKSKESIKRWRVFKDSIFLHHCTELEGIFEEFGYPGHSMVGEDGALSFWLMVQHCDHDLAFQRRVLTTMKTELDRENINARHFGLLTDRVRKNSAQKQLYGTQVTYNDQGQAIPRPLEDSLNVDKRRKEIGLESIKEYLNRMTTNHFNMNKDNFLKKGITQPLLYE